MSGLGWQDAVVALLVLCALGYLVWRKVSAKKSASPCGDCPGCAAPVSPPRQDEQRTAELPILRITADKDR
jgi:hypothetical protein